MEELSINQQVFVKDDPGIIRFIGQTQFASGKWIGVELQRANGKNDGSVNDIRYFECEKKDGNYGVFVRQSLISSSSLQKSKATDTSNLENIINKLQDKLRNANEEAKELKRKIEQLKEEVIQHQNATQSVESKLEMVTTDKEFLEESNHKVNQALDELQSKYEDLRTDFQIMSEEVQLNNQIEQEIIASMEHSNANEVDIQIILSRNKSLEIALTSLQKLSAENELNLKKEIHDLNQRLVLNEKEIGSHDQLLRNISVAQETIDSLQSQLDSALQSEKMIEHLNIENDSLNSKVSSLTKTVDELTELHELDKSLEENQALVEKELRKDIYNLSSKIMNNEIVIQDLDRKNKYMESKISEFKKRSNNNVSDDENLEDLQIQLEALQLEFKKAQASNESYRITHDLINSKLEILQENMHLPNATYTTVLKILLLIKIVVSSISVVNNIVTMAIDKGATYRKSILFTVTNRFYTLKSFLQNVSALWEFNYGHETYTSVEDKFYKKVSDLQLKIDNSTTYLKEGDYEGINTDYIHDFLLETIELMDLKFEEEETGVYFLNASCSKFLLESFQNEASICIKIVNILKGFLDTSHGIKEENIPSIEQLDKISSTSLRQETKFDQLILELNDAFSNGKSINISMSSMPHFSSSLAELNSPIGLLSNILAQIEVESRLNKSSVSIDASLVKNIFENKEVGSNSKFTSLLEILKRRDCFMELQVIDNHRILPGIYSLLDGNHIALDVNTTKNDAEEELKLIKPKYAGISTKLFEKEKIIQELQLNIKFLQNSMESTSVKNKEYIQNLKIELDQIKDKNEESHQKYQDLLEANQKLELEIEELLGSPSIIEGGGIFKKFANLETENQHNANMALLDEIMVLRKLLKYNSTNQESRKDPSSDWLEQPLVTKFKTKNSLDVALGFERNSSYLRDISKNIKLVNISNNSTLWRPKATMPKYMALTLEEKATNYFEQRSLTLS
ncbi:DEHA2F14806p [Debaryomyces hansenii CBS767]|uniref:DEHA2F14806p n=1 Tax=Debaryomyces hansenii (strain ATCC 36239 / CBS 767 / BCRC 21394 / JCM 1990 / NBRC 0083 / IGC 2968) TaxID=284592 RepID=Q6BLB7_DEBHA|nr:DEHA2F14806p [Debaryomyces hansenii CBS767]CAG89374.2 DEHA2F14806p [Debaryomyces hansenii CBS767]|eukprot:XP_461004.2 DEHA2F14806p [Debaryomyces hansenii CBS767]